MIAIRERLALRVDDGAALVAVVIVMAVGFVIASTIAASVMFAITANADNKQGTQAFIAAESGRDAAVASIKAAVGADGALVCGSVALTGTGTAPTYSYSIAATSSATRPSSFTDAGVVPGCPTSASHFVVIRSTGSDSSTSTTVDSVYDWSVRLSDVPGGVVTFFSGSVTNGVAHYTGDLVLRDGDWNCNIGGTLDGDLYVLTGTVGLANNCTINGDIYSAGNVDGTSQSWHINARGATSTGSITTNGTVHLRSTGGTSVAGGVSAKGQVVLDGNGTGTVGGPVSSSGNTATANSSWTTGGLSGPTGVDPVFSPTLAWLRAATQWIDLNASAGWGTRYSGTCSLSNASLISLVGTAGAPLVLDFTTCPNSATLFNGQQLSITFPNVTVARDVVILSPANRKLTVSLNGTIRDDGNKRQVYLVHVDTNADHLPTCGNGNTQDQFDVSGSVDANLRLMVYAPCGLGGTVNASFSGQLYADDTTHFISSSTYTCKTMMWTTVLPKLGCSIRGDGGVIDDSSLIESLGDLEFQSEQ